MAPRPYWKGYLKLSLVACPVALYPATSASERISFRQINKQTGNRLRQQLVDEVTREPVDAADKGRGYEVERNVYLPVEEEELEAIQVESTHTIEIDSFVPVKQIDDRFFESPYYIVPNDNVGQEAFAVIRDAMKGKGVAGLGRVVLAKRERPIILQPFGKGLRGMTLRYAYEVRDEKDYFDDIPDMKIPAEMLKLAEHIIEGKADDFKPQEFVDHYEVALVEMLKTKQAGRIIPKEERKVAYRATGNVIELLKQSIAAEKTAPKKAKKRAEGQREMLLPIKGKKVEQKKAAKPAARQRKAG